MSDILPGAVIPLRDYSEPAGLEVRQQIKEVLAILHAIDDGEMLAALPECEVARTQHQTALTLLRLAERQLSQLSENVF